MKGSLKYRDGMYYNCDYFYAPEFFVAKTLGEIA